MRTECNKVTMHMFMAIERNNATIYMLVTTEYSYVTCRHTDRARRMQKPAHFFFEIMVICTWTLMYESLQFGRQCQSVSMLTYNAWLDPGHYTCSNNVPHNMWILQSPAHGSQQSSCGKRKHCNTGQGCIP